MNETKKMLQRRVITKHDSRKEDIMQQRIKRRWGNDNNAAVNVKIQGKENRKKP